MREVVQRRFAPELFGSCEIGDRCLISVAPLLALCREIHYLKPVQAVKAHPFSTIRKQIGTLTMTEPRRETAKGEAIDAFDADADDWRKRASAGTRAEARRALAAALLPREEAPGDAMRTAEAVGRTEHAEAIMAAEL